MSTFTLFPLELITSYSICQMKKGYLKPPPFAWVIIPPYNLCVFLCRNSLESKMLKFSTLDGQRDHTPP